MTEPSVEMVEPSLKMVEPSVEMVKEVVDRFSVSPDTRAVFEDHVFAFLPRHEHARLLLFATARWGDAVEKDERRAFHEEAQQLAENQKKMDLLRSQKLAENQKNVSWFLLVQEIANVFGGSRWIQQLCVQEVFSFLPFAEHWLITQFAAENWGRDFFPIAESGTWVSRSIYQSLEAALESHFGTDWNQVRSVCAQKGIVIMGSWPLWALLGEKNVAGDIDFWMWDQKEPKVREMKRGKTSVSPNEATRASFYTASRSDHTSDDPAKEFLKFAKHEEATPTKPQTDLYHVHMGQKIGFCSITTFWSEPRQTNETLKITTPIQFIRIMPMLEEDRLQFLDEEHELNEIETDPVSEVGTKRKLQAATKTRSGVFPFLFREFDLDQCRFAYHPDVMFRWPTQMIDKAVKKIQTFVPGDFLRPTSSQRWKLYNRIIKYKDRGFSTTFCDSNHVPCKMDDFWKLVEDAVKAREAAAVGKPPNT